MTTLTLDLGAAEPPYEQIRSQVAGHIASGALRDGDRLPTIRALAGQLGIAANTVARAYRELEGAGLIATRRRTGTVVTATAGPGATEPVRSSAARFVAESRRAGLSEADALDLVRAAYRTS